MFSVKSLNFLEKVIYLEGLSVEQLEDLLRNGEISQEEFDSIIRKRGLHGLFNTNMR